MVVDQHVGRLNISVENTLTVGVINRVGKVTQHSRSGRRIYGLAIRPRCCMAQSVWRILLTV